jgi:hypothetical protein
MGNSLPLPCVCRCCCHDEVNELEEGTAGVPGGAKKRRRKQQQRPDRSRNVWAARPRHVVVPVVDAPEDGDGGREQEAWPECRVELAGHSEDGAVRVRIVMKRKDIAQLVARLEQRGAEERNAAAGMEEVISTELAGCSSGNADGGGGVTMISPRRDAWSPRLSIIPEN